MKSYVIKHEPSNTFVTISDEFGPISVPLDNAQLFSLDIINEILNPNFFALEYIEGIVGEILREDISVYEVEINLLNKI